jgi:dephospho-CoA kinase
MRRLVGRGWGPVQIRQRLAAQMPVAEKIARADFLVWTETSLELHAAQLDRIFRPWR